MKYSDNAIEIYKRLYFDETKNETIPEQVHERVANFIGNNVGEQEEFKKILNEKAFRPNTPCLINAGRKSDKSHDTQLVACFILNLNDSMDSIIEMWSLCAKIYASGAGAGIPITNLREKGSPISSGGNASGCLRYMKVVDILSETVRSGGRNRRASNIGVFKHNHPETMDIIESKTKEKRELENFNLSMSVTNDYMEKLINNQSYQFPIISPNGNKTTAYRNNMLLWDKIIKNAWECGDPGLFFIDTTNRFNPFPKTYPIECLNVCAEIALPPWSICNLGAINLNNVYDEIFNSIDYDKLKMYVQSGVRFLDNVIDKTSYLHPKFEEMTKTNRSIGLGFMGFADLLIKLDVEYGSKESIKLFEDICYFITKEAIKQSIVLAKEKGRIDIPEQDYNHFKNLLMYYTKGDDEIIKEFKQCGIRNSTWTCLQPTGSVSLSADCSYAWEPLMALIWEKPLTDSDRVLKMVHPEFEKDLHAFIAGGSPKTEKETINDIINNHGSIQNIDYLPEKMKRKYKVAHDINPFKKIDMQSAGQKFISMAISSTCNLPNSATEKDISDIFKYAYQMGLKGITVFRDGCLNKQVVNFGKVKDKEEGGYLIPDKDGSYINVSTIKEVEDILKDNNITKTDLQSEAERIVSGIKFNNDKRPIKRSGDTVEIDTPYGNLFVTCNLVNKKPIEIFFRVGKQGALTNVLIDALGRVCSKALQNGVSFDDIINTLIGLKGEKFWYKISDEAEHAESAESIVDAIAQIMEYHWSYKEELKKDDNVCYDKCPQCHRNTLRHDTGCRNGACMACGYSNCG